MNPEQVDAAADLADAAIYAGGRGFAGGEESWARALLRRGWDLSRKAAIAGVAATAAPVIAPPIIILSIAGVALSVPFAAFLASVAATDRLMNLLLPPATPQPYYTYDFRDEESDHEFLDASGAPDQEAPVFGYRNKTEEDAILEQNEVFASLPLSQEPHVSEELVPLLANEEGDNAEGEFANQISGQELFVPVDEKQKDNDTTMKVENEYITMEAATPGDDALVFEVPLLRDGGNIFQRMEGGAPGPAQESVQENKTEEESVQHNKTEDGKPTITVQIEYGNSKDMLLRGLHTTHSSDLALPMLGDNDAEKYSNVSDSGDKTQQHKTTEIMPRNEVNVSLSQGLDDITVPSRLEDEIEVEMVPKEDMRDINHVTGEGVHVQLDEISTTEPVSESMQSRHQVAPKLQDYVQGTLGSNLTKCIVKDAGNKSTKGVEYCGDEGVPSIMTMDNDKDLISTRSKLNAMAISDDMTGVGSKPHADHPNQITCVANKEHGKQKVVEDKCVETEETKAMDNKVSTTYMAAQDDRISESLVPDDQSMREDVAILEMVLEQVTTSIDPVTGEVVDVEVDIIARESESLPLSDLVAHELQAVTGAGTIIDEAKDIVKGIGDTNVVDVEHQSGEGASSFVSVTSVLTVDDGEDLMSTRSTPCVSAISNDTPSVEGRLDLEHRHQTTAVENKVKDREFETKVLTEDTDIYTEEQLREQLNTLRTITGYRAAPSLTLEGELAGLYIFVGVEPPHSTGDASSLTKLNRKLRFLKSIIGVE